MDRLIANRAVLCFESEREHTVIISWGRYLVKHRINRAGALIL